MLCYVFVIEAKILIYNGDILKHTYVPFKEIHQSWLWEK